MANALANPKVALWGSNGLRRMIDSPRRNA